MYTIIRNTKLFRSISSFVKKRYSSNVTPFTRPKSTTNSTTTTTTTTTTTNGSSTNAKYTSKTKLLFFRIIRVGRIVFISYSLYQIGYSQGFIDYAKNPEKMHHDLIHSTLKQSNANSIYTEYSIIYNRVNNIFTNILISSRHHVKSRIEFIENRLKVIKKELDNNNNNNDNNNIIDYRGER